MMKWMSYSAPPPGLSMVRSFLASLYNTLCSTSGSNRINSCLSAILSRNISMVCLEAVLLTTTRRVLPFFDKFTSDSCIIFLWCLNLDWRFRAPRKIDLVKDFDLLKSLFTLFRIILIIISGILMINFMWTAVI